jgi:DNA replication and repair protein RecF
LPDAPDSPRPRLILERLVVRDLRNLERLLLEPGRRLNVISGANGHGKTSLLEAIYFAATSRSFRTAQLAELVRHGSDGATVRATFSEQGGSAVSREQTAVVKGRRASVRLDGNVPDSLAAFATRSPIVAFHPAEMALSTGPASGRRTLLDRLALFLDPASADHRARYARALRTRQKLLQTAGPSTGVDAFEEIAAVHGAALTRARRVAAEAFAIELATAFAEIAAPGLTLTARFAPGGSEDPNVARNELHTRRDRDAHRPHASFGPHKDDLELDLGGHPARGTASQGQHRALTLALKAAESACIAAVRDVEPILLLDDVSSELDSSRTQALFSFLARARGQIFLTTTRPDLIVTPHENEADRRDFVLVAGALTAAPKR